LVKAQRFLLEHVPVAGRIVPERMERIDQPLYPPLAVREALANAICHRDYAIGGGSIGIGLYDDRLEVTSSGTLHFGLTPAALFEPHESLPWNPLIASVFHRRGMIETWGRGTLKMAELAEVAGLPQPEIEEIAGAVVVRFRLSRQIPPSRAGQELTDRQRVILAALAAAPSLSMGQLLQRLGNQYPERTVQQDLALLKQLGRVELGGFGRGARWRIKP
jgi:ATP-dependent DNA helicase RecG